METEDHFLLDCAARKDKRTALYDAIDTMVTAARADKGDRNSFSVQQVSCDVQWCLLTGEMVKSVGKEELRRRVIARILVSIAQWTLERKETLAGADKARRA